MNLAKAAKAAKTAADLKKSKAKRLDLEKKGREDELNRQKKKTAKVAVSQTKPAPVQMKKMPKAASATRN